MKTSKTEEDYLKAIFSLSLNTRGGISTNSISEELGVKPPSATDMLKKLTEKKYIKHEPYQGVRLLKSGEEVALRIIRKHRLWETFLVDTLNFKWDEVHEIAEQLEHIKSVELTDRLDQFLGFPKFDPHGDPIPSKDGVISFNDSTTLDKVSAGNSFNLIGVNEDSSEFLKFLGSKQIQLGTVLDVVHRNNFDSSIEVMIDKKHKELLTERVCKNLVVKDRNE